MHGHLPPGIEIAKAENLEEWQMDIKVLDDNPLYKDQTYRLKFTFSSKYPIGMWKSGHSPSCPVFYYFYTLAISWRAAVANDTVEPPEVQFIELQPSSGTPRPIPIHPHIYSNGIICLDLLSSVGWSPVQTVESVCMSIQSMLTANTRNERPPDNNDFVSYNRRRPRDINFYYHDDNVWCPVMLWCVFHIYTFNDEYDGFWMIFSHAPAAEFVSVVLCPLHLHRR